jgi:hypothetical protein
MNPKFTKWPGRKKVTSSETTQVPKKPRKRVEATIMNSIIAELRLLGYLVFHDNDSLLNESGFPDIVAVGFGKALILELKAGKNKPTEKQAKWIAEFSDAGIDARIFYVEDWYKSELRNEMVELSRTAKRARREAKRIARLATEKDVY